MNPIDDHHDYNTINNKRITSSSEKNNNKNKKNKDGVTLRRERHPPSDGISGVGKPPAKSGHGGRFTWEGPAGVAESQLEPAPAAIDPKDPNFVAGDHDYDHDHDYGGDDVAVVGEVEVAKVAEIVGREGVSRVEVV